MAGVLIVTGGMMEWVRAMAVPSGHSRSGRGMCRVRVRTVRVCRRGRSVARVRRLAMSVRNIRGRRQWLRVIVKRRIATCLGPLDAHPACATSCNSPAASLEIGTDDASRALDTCTSLRFARRACEEWA